MFKIGQLRVWRDLFRIDPFGQEHGLQFDIDKAVHHPRHPKIQQILRR